MEETRKPTGNPFIFRGNLEELIIYTGHDKWSFANLGFYCSPICELSNLSAITQRDMIARGYDALIHADVVVVPGPNLSLFYIGLPVKKILS